LVEKQGSKEGARRPPQAILGETSAAPGRRGPGTEGWMQPMETFL